MCPAYYALLGKLDEIYSRAELDVMELRRLRRKIDAHLKECRECKDDRKFVAKGNEHGNV
jgi:predicted anti-sigma-YlaC factor YlaD